MSDTKALISKLNTHNRDFLSQLFMLKALGTKLTHQDVDLLLSAQDRGKTYSLGHFVGDQTSAIANAAISMTSVLQNQYLRDVYYKKNEVTAAFIEASSELRLRHESHYGARYVNTVSSSQNEDALPKEADFSVLPFMTGTSVSDLDKMICLVTDTPLSQRSLSMLPKTWGGLLGYGLKRAGTFLGLYTLAPALELVLTGVHLALALPATILRVLVSPLVGIGLLKHENFLDKYIENLDNIHRFISPVRYFKGLWNAQYKRFDDRGQPLASTNPHQEMLDTYNQYKKESALVNATKAITNPQNSLAGLRLGFHLGYQAGGTLLNSIGALVTSPLSLFKRRASDSEIFQQYDENYHLIKPVMDTLVTEAEKSVKKPSSFPHSSRQIDYSAESPARVINEVMYLLNEKVIHHLAENQPGPATFFFMMSVATFGSNFAPVGMLAWMHGAPGYFKLVQAGLGQAFTGYAGPVTGFSGGVHGSVAAMLQFKLFTIGTSVLLSSGDKNNDILEHMAKNPEKIIAGFVAFVGVGYALGYVPKIPPLPTSFSVLGQHISMGANGVNPLDGFGMAINAITQEAADARGGIMPFTTLEYGFLGYKTMLLMHSMTLNGKTAATPQDITLILNAFKREKILSLESSKRTTVIGAILKTMNHPTFSSPAFIEKMQLHLTQFIEQDSSILQTKLQTTNDAIAKERAQWDALIAQSSKKASYKEMNSYDKLQRSIQMLSDKDTPCTFTKRRDAIQYYNQLSRTFDEYNEEVKKGTTGKYPGHKPIPKEDFLRAFRNKHISTGSNNFARLLSFYPGYPIRFLWREAQLKLNPNSPYVIDKIKASREKDVVLRNDWVAIAKMSAFNFVNLCNKAIKATLGAIPTIVIVGLGVLTNIGRGISGKPLDWTRMGVRLQQLGRVLDNIAIQNLMPWSSQRARFAEAAHESSRYDDLIGAGEKVNQRLVANGNDNSKKITPVSNSTTAITKPGKPPTPTHNGLAATTVKHPDKKSTKPLSRESISELKQPKTNHRGAQQPEQIQVQDAPGSKHRV